MATKKSGRIPIMSKAFAAEVKARLEQNRTYGGSASTKKEAEEIAKNLKKNGYVTVISKVDPRMWLVEKSSYWRR